MAGLLAQNEDNPGEPGERPDGPNLIVNDVIPLPIGLALANGRFSPIIKAQSVIPLEAVKEYVTSRAN